MPKALSSLKKYKNTILNIIISIIYIIIIYESIFIEVKYWRAVIFGLLLIGNFVDIIGFWKKNQNSNK